MFEPLRDIIGDHSDKLYDLLKEMRDHLADIANQEISEVEYDQFTTRNGRATVGADGTAIIELTPSEGFSWKLERIALTASEEGNCAVYIGAVAPENLVDVFREPKITSDRGKYFVPRGMALTLHFYEQEPGAICTVNMQAEQLIPVVKVSRTVSGRSNEAMDHPRVSPVPSGQPLTEVQIASH